MLSLKEISLQRNRAEAAKEQTWELYFLIFFLQCGEWENPIGNDSDTRGLRDDQDMNNQDIEKKLNGLRP